MFITRDEHVKLLDFGLAKEVKPAASDPEGMTFTLATRQGTVMGTVGYMSPEQVRGESADLRSDVFSFGVVLYEMLLARIRSSGARPRRRRARVLRDEVPGLSSRAIDVPSGIERIVSRCLEKRRDARFGSGRELAAALSMCRDEEQETLAGEKRRRWSCAIPNLELRPGGRILQ